MRSRIRLPLRGAALALIALGALPGSTVLTASTARAAPAPQRMGGTWDLSWRNRRGEIRKGSMVVTQRGSQIVAEVYDRGGATATGSIAGPSFTLQGSRLALPFTVTGRVQGRKMTGILVAAGFLERRFTGVRRGRR